MPIEQNNITRQEQQENLQEYYIFHTNNDIELKLDAQHNVIFFSVPGANITNSPLLLSPSETRALLKVACQQKQNKTPNIINKLIYYCLLHYDRAAEKNTNYQSNIVGSAALFPAVSQKEVTMLLEQDIERIQHRQDGNKHKPPKKWRPDSPELQAVSENFAEWYNAPLLTPWQEARLTRAYAYSKSPHIKQKALNELLKRNIRLITQIVNSFEQTYGSSLDMRLQEGFVVFMEELPRFDPQKGYRLSTFINPCLREYVLRRIIEQYAAPVKLSIVALRGGSEKVRNIQHPVHLDGPAFQQEKNDKDPLAAEEVYDLSMACIEHTALNNLVAEEIKQEIEAAQLPARQKLVVLLYCGMRQREINTSPKQYTPPLGYSFREIGKLLGLTGNTVSADFQKATEVLRRNPRLRHLFEDYFNQPAPTTLPTEEPA